MLKRLSLGCAVGAAIGAAVATVSIYAGVLIDYIIKQINTNLISIDVVFFVFVVVIGALIGIFFTPYRPNKS